MVMSILSYTWDSVSKEGGKDRGHIVRGKRGSGRGYLVSLPLGEEISLARKRGGGCASPRRRVYAWGGGYSLLRTGGGFLIDSKERGEVRKMGKMMKEREVSPLGGDGK